MARTLYQSPPLYWGAPFPPRLAFVAGHGPPSRRQPFLPELTCPPYTHSDKPLLLHKPQPFNTTHSQSTIKKMKQVFNSIVITIVALGGAHFHGVLAEDAIPLQLTFGSQPLSAFTCSSNTGPGFATVRLGAPARSRSNLPQLTQSQCVMACLDEDVREGDLGCCESKPDGECTLYADATMTFDGGRSPATVFGIENADSPLCPSLSHRFLVKDRVVCPAATRPRLPCDRAQLSEAAARTEMTALMAAAAFDQNELYLPDVLLNVTATPLGNVDGLAVDMTYKTGSPINLDALARAADRLVSSSYSYSADRCGCTVVGVVAAANSATVVPGPTTSPSGAPTSQCAHPYTGPTRARRSAMSTTPEGAASTTPMVVVGVAAAVALVAVVAVVVARRSARSRQLIVIDSSDDFETGQTQAF